MKPFAFHIIRLTNGKLLAFCEGRVTGSDDFGNIDIVMKRSSDDGKTIRLKSSIQEY